MGKIVMLEPRYLSWNTESHSPNAHYETTYTQVMFFHAYYRNHAHIHIHTSETSTGTHLQYFKHPHRHSLLHRCVFSVVSMPCFMNVCYSLWPIWPPILGTWLLNNVDYNIVTKMNKSNKWFDSFHGELSTMLLNMWVHAVFHSLNVD